MTRILEISYYKNYIGNRKGISSRKFQITRIVLNWKGTSEWKFQIARIKLNNTILEGSVVSKNWQY